MSPSLNVIAIHEAGHALWGLMHSPFLRYKIHEVSIIQDKTSYGHIEYKGHVKASPDDKANMFLAGIAAEKILTGSLYDHSVQDLTSAYTNLGGSLMNLLNKYHEVLDFFENFKDILKDLVQLLMEKKTLTAKEIHLFMQEDLKS
jgi:ATP-dependent Zn protease